MRKPITQRARRLAFALGGAALLLELAFLVMVSHARAPEGQFLAGSGNAQPAVMAPATGVIMLRTRELSL